MAKLISTLLLFTVFLYCDTSRRVNKKLEQYFLAGDWQKITETLYEIEQKEKDIEDLDLWKARMYSLSRETYPLARKFYLSYIQENPEPQIYYEFALFLMDIHDYKTLQFILNGENLHPSILFDPTINDLRNFVDCWNSIQKNQRKDILMGKAGSLHDAYLSLFCEFFLLDTAKKKVERILRQENLVPVDILGHEFLRSWNDFYQRYTAQKKQKPVEEKEALETIHHTLEKFSGKKQDLYGAQFCALQRFFPDIKISAMSKEECRKVYPNFPNILRETGNPPGTSTSLPTLFPDRDYIY